MPTRRIMLMTVVTVTLMFPARATVEAWGRRQLLTKTPGSFLYETGVVLETIL